MAEYGEWNRKGGTLSDVTAQKKYGVTRDFFERGLNKTERQEHPLAALSAIPLEWPAATKGTGLTTTMEYESRPLTEEQRAELELVILRSRAHQEEIGPPKSRTCTAPFGARSASRPWKLSNVIVRHPEQWPHVVYRHHEC